VSTVATLIVVDFVTVPAFNSLVSRVRVSRSPANWPSLPLMKISLRRIPSARLSEMRGTWPGSPASEIVTPGIRSIARYSAVRRSAGPRPLRSASAAYTKAPV
jgi:hypothetical protein